MSPRRIDASHAAAVLSANGSQIPPAALQPGAPGYNAYRHADKDEADAWFAYSTTFYNRTLVAWGMIEGGWLSLWDMWPERRFTG